MSIIDHTPPSTVTLGLAAHPTPAPGASSAPASQDGPAHLSPEAFARLSPTERGRVLCAMETVRAMYAYAETYAAYLDSLCGEPGIVSRREVRRLFWSCVAAWRTSAQVVNAPYRAWGRTVYWVIKPRGRTVKECDTPERAQRIARLLNALRGTA